VSRPGEEIRLEVDKLVGGGRALGHHDGEAVFVAGALPGEEVVAATTARRAGIVEAEIVELAGEPHPARIADPCPHASPAGELGPCGGCDWPHVDPEAGAGLKAAAAAEAARRFPEAAGRLAQATVRSSPLEYRLRARLHWDPDRRLLGFFQRRSWTVTPIPECRIISPGLSAALEPMTSALAAGCPAPVDLEWLEDLEGRRAVAALRAGTGGGAERIEAHWIPAPEAVPGILDGFHALSSSGKPITRWGSESVAMNLPIPLEVPIGSFFQGNRHLTPWLFDRVAELAGPAPAPVFDLHAGVGLLAAAARHSADRDLRLVEPHRPAARAAASNLPGAKVSVGRTAEAFLDRARSLPSEALVLADPPRAGMSPTLRHRLAGWHPDRILTLACDPVTWARDTTFLVDRGYRLSHVELVDLFPSTHHVEVLAVLESA
jgi:tRNA/tmRNA/rRNA uracil-C5-methylase (TrmA/RlmC/RlmD family)